MAWNPDMDGLIRRTAVWLVAWTFGFAAEIPFVGCPLEGQAGHRDPPSGSPVTVPISADTARQLAWYQAAFDVGVLAPRGWHCRGSYGSSGTGLVVRPQLDDSGLGVSLGVTHGYTFGRFSVAEMIARLFPSRIAWAEKVRSAYGQAPLPAGPYPADRLLYRDSSLAEYETPPRAEGLGTTPGVGKSHRPTRGIVMLTDSLNQKDRTPNMVRLAIRLPREHAALGPVIIRETARWANLAKSPARQ